MAFIPAPNVLQARMRYNWGAQLIENTLYFVGSAGVTVALANSLGAALVTWWNTNFKPITSNLMALDQVYISDLTADNSFTVAYSTGLPLVGTNATEALPSMWHTAFHSAPPIEAGADVDATTWPG